MTSSDQLAGMVRWALRRLYDPVALRTSPLVALLGLHADRNPAKRLQQVLISAIEACEPGPEVPEQSRAWRLHEVLRSRYVEQSGQQQVADQLGIGVRHLRREEVEAITALAHLLEPAIATTTGLAHAEPGRHEPTPPSSPDDPQRCATPLNEVLIGAIETVAPLADRHLVHLAPPPADMLQSICCCIEPMALRQVLINLLCVAVRQTPGGEVRVDVHSDGAELVLMLIGVGRSHPVPRDADDCENIALTAALLNRYEATLTLSPPEADFVATLITLASPAITVMVVEDNADTLSLLQRYVASSPYRVLGLGQAERAIEMACENQPDVIVLDVMMPTVDGWELLGRLQQHPQTSHIPLIVCTILAQEELARTLGARDFVHKPVTRQAFLAALDRQAPAIGGPAHRSH